MHLNLRNGLLAGGYLLLGVVAVVGWARHSGPAAVAAAEPTGYSQSAAPTAGQYSEATNATNAGATVSTQDTNATAQEYSQGYNPRGYNANDCTPATQSIAYDDQYLIPGNAPLVVRPAPVQYAMASQEEAPPTEQGTGYYYHGRHYRHHRSLKKSLAIVGGTAGVGAAIGGIAAGGRGAALGAVSGGAAGFLYDRLTHNR